VAKTEFNTKKNLFASKFDLTVKNELLKGAAFGT
jgi:hypothetical protein